MLCIAVFPQKGFLEVPLKFTAPEIVEKPKFRSEIADCQRQSLHHLYNSPVGRCGIAPYTSNRNRTFHDGHGTPCPYKSYQHT